MLMSRIRTIIGLLPSTTLVKQYLGYQLTDNGELFGLSFCGYLANSIELSSASNSEGKSEVIKSKCSSLNQIHNMALVVTEQRGLYLPIVVSSSVCVDAVTWQAPSNWVSSSIRNGKSGVTRVEEYGEFSWRSFLTPSLRFFVGIKEGAFIGGGWV